MRIGLVLLLVVASPALADIAPAPEFGQTLSVPSTCDVVMTGEVVRITLGPGEATVRAVFDLRNTGDGTSLEVGFPDVILPASWSTNAPPEGVAACLLDGFEARVDGDPVETTHRYFRNREIATRRAGIEAEIARLLARLEGAGTDAARRSIEGDLARRRQELDGWRYAGWIVWTMEFERGGTRRVEVAYRVPYRPSYRATLLGDATFTYVLTTGAAWKGVIGHAVIEVAYAEGFGGDRVSSVEPPGFERHGKGIRWDLHDLEPDANVVIGVRKYPDHAAAAEAYLSAAREAGDGTGLLALAALCQEKAGRFAECVTTCRAIVVAEKRARATGKGTPWAGVGYRKPYVPWECLVVTCLVHLGRVDEARAAAREAIVALEAVVRASEREVYADRADLAKRIRGYRIFVGK